MEFIERETQYSGKRRIVKVDENNIPTGEPDILVNLIKDEGAVYVEGTPLDKDTFSKLNWRDDASVVFVAKNDDILPISEIGKVKIVSKQNGEIWIIPSSESGKSAYFINNPKTLIKVNGIPQSEWNADSKLDKTATAENSLQLGGYDANAYALKVDVPEGSTLYQAKGQAVNGSMTQKSTTDELNSLDAKITAETQSRINADNEKISKNGDTMCGGLNFSNTPTVGAQTTLSGTHLTTTDTEIVLQQTGDLYGTSSLALQNRSGANGAIFRNTSLDLVDFGFRPSEKAGGNIRFEGRAMQANARNTEGEFEIMNPEGAYTTKIGVGANSVVEFLRPLQLTPSTNINPQNGDLWNEGQNLYFRCNDANIVLNSGKNLEELKNQMNNINLGNFIISKIYTGTSFRLDFTQPIQNGRASFKKYLIAPAGTDIMFVGQSQSTSPLSISIPKSKGSYDNQFVMQTITLDKATTFIYSQHLVTYPPTSYTRIYGSIFINDIVGVGMSEGPSYNQHNPAFTISSDTSFDIYEFQMC